jgi:hypothetical protein
LERFATKALDLGNILTYTQLDSKLGFWLRRLGTKFLVFIRPVRALHLEIRREPSSWLASRQLLPRPNLEPCHSAMVASSRHKNLGRPPGRFALLTCSSLKMFTEHFQSIRSLAKIQILSLIEYMATKGLFNKPGIEDSNFVG